MDLTKGQSKPDGQPDNIVRPKAIASETATDAQTPGPFCEDHHVSEPPPTSGDPLLDSPTPTQSTPAPDITPNIRPSDTHGGPHCGQGPNDHVYPIRSVVSVDPYGKSLHDDDYFSRVRSESTPVGPSRLEAKTPRNHRGSVTSDTAPLDSPIALPATRLATRMRHRRCNTVSGSAWSSPSDVERRGSAGPLPIFTDDMPSDDDNISEGTDDLRRKSTVSSTSGRNSGDALPEQLVTTRFTHIMTDEGHAVITGRDGTLQRCEDEPIHAPGAVQAFGALVAIREESDGRFTARYASENSKKIVGYSPQELFRLSNVMDILTEEQVDNLLDHIDFIKDEDADPSVNGPEVFSMSIRLPKKKSVKLWCAIHINPAHPDLVICEFELDDDQEYPLRPSDELTPDVPKDTLDSNPTLEEVTESTEVLSKPLRVLRSARKRRGEAGAMQVFDIMSQVQEQLASAPNLEVFLKILVGIVKELTGFHRVMIYQFDSFFNGKVVTELVDPVQTSDLYKGLHFPAPDIPKQARDLYKVNKVRLLYDRDHETARLVCRSKEDLDVSLDMTHAYLRAMSPIHLKYLANMAVRSSMSISINAFNELWGLIACHSYGNKGIRVSFPIRKMCRLIGDTVSRNIERLSYASRLQARKLINTVPTERTPSGYIIASSDDLLKLFDADFGMLSIQGETKILGLIEHSQEALAMLEYLRLRKFTSVVTTQDIRVDFPDLRYPPGFSVIAGLLYVPLSVGGNDFIVFFRKGRIRDVKWAGNPYEKIIQEGTTAYLEPRTSFQVWHETVIGKCREWSEEQVETAAVLCLVYGKFIEVWRQKEAALQSSRLTRLLLANSAHEVRTPLNAIINYLEIALEGTLDQETRDNLAKSHSASKSLIYVINDLLDLTKTEKGQGLIKDEIFDLLGCIREATDPFTSDAMRKGISYEVVQHEGLPKFVYGDHRRVRQAIANVAANAVENTSRGGVTIEVYVSEVAEQKATIEIVFQDSGQGMNNQQLDALFRELEQVSTDFDDVQPSETEDEELKREDRALGLGLAVVARIIRNMDGQLRLKSEEGKGSRFIMQLPFHLPPSDSPESLDDGGGTMGSNNTPSVSASVSATIPPIQKGEMTLIDRASSGVLGEKKSFDEINSIASQRSVTSMGSGRSSKSDADRLIDAIRTPLSLGDKELDLGKRQRHHSREPHSRARPGSVGSASAVLPGSLASPESPTSNKEQPSATAPVLSHSMGAKDSLEHAKGVYFVQDSRVPIRPVRIPDEYQDMPSQPSQPIMRKRLEKAGHTVSQATDGEDCATLYKDKSTLFDIILMDMQMPIVDGLTSTKMIRAFEHSADYNGLSARAGSYGRIPIFAVSASLVEHERSTYVDAGFDGWILKPINFKRLETLLRGIVDDEVRNGNQYAPGEWERGGWFRKRDELEASELAVGAGDLPQGTVKGR